MLEINKKLMINIRYGYWIKLMYLNIFFLIFLNWYVILFWYFNIVVKSFIILKCYIFLLYINNRFVGII